ncbi:hypothetical protein TeGR_g14586, partial [Tetraparma gracilis]
FPSMSSPPPPLPVAFVVSCPDLGHGQSVRLVGDLPELGGGSVEQGVPLHTSVLSFPYYETAAPIHLSPATPLPAATPLPVRFSYRYAVFSGGRFERWEGAFPRVLSLSAPPPSPPAPAAAPGAPPAPPPLQIVADELGEPSDDRPPLQLDLEELPPSPTRFSSAHRSSLGSRPPSPRRGRPDPSSPSSPSSPSPPSSPAGSKKVAFSSPPAAARRSSTEPASRPQPRTPASQAASLDSSDGAIVVSIFLPIILNRSPAGEWTADWDHENLLSMSSHMRVTRVGTVKWRGWHGNFGSK